MTSKMISIILVTALLHVSMAAQNQPQPPAQTAAKMQQVLHKAQDKGKAVKVTLNRKIDNRNKLTGTVSEISDTGFTFNDQKTGRGMQVAYADVREVKQKGMSKTAKILIVSGIVVGAVVGLGFALACSSEGGPNC
jgi:histidinol dehydrogenase